MQYRLLVVLAAAGCQQGGHGSGNATGSAATQPPVTSSSVTRPAPAPTPPPPVTDKLAGALAGKRTDVSAIAGAAMHAEIGDLDGDGKPELVLVDAKEIRVVAPDGKLVASAPVTAGIERLLVADIDGDHKAEIYSGWGQTREHMDTKAAVTVHRLDHGSLVAETIAAPATERNDVTALVPMPDDKALLVAYFDSKYNVTAAVARRGASGWSTKPLESIRMATSYARGDVDGDGKPDVVVGRMYGDDTGVDGDAFVRAPDGKRTKIPSTRGMRSLAVIDGDIFMGDGWHQSYAREGHGLLSEAHHAAGAFATQVVEDTAGQYSIEKIVPATIDGKRVIVTLGNRYVRAFMRVGDTWRGITIGGIARDIAAGDLDGTPGDEVLVVGDTSQIVKLAATDWTR